MKPDGFGEDEIRKKLKLRDRDLLLEIIKLPNSAQARIAHEILEYKKYRTERLQNIAMIAFSSAVTGSAILSLFVSIADFATKYKVGFREALIQIFSQLF